jgi:hypothetical protein
VISGRHGKWPEPNLRAGSSCGAEWAEGNLAMPQLQLPLFADGLTSINDNIAFQREGAQVVYFHGMMPVFQHGEKDVKSFRMFTSQMIANAVFYGVPIIAIVGSRENVRKGGHL